MKNILIIVGMPAAGKNLARNELVVVQGHEHPLLLSSTLQAADLSWIDSPPQAGNRYTAKTRYRQQDAVCEVQALSAETMTLHFDPFEGDKVRGNLDLKLPGKPGATVKGNFIARVK